MSQQVFTGVVLHLSDYLFGLPLDLPQHLHIFKMLGTVELDTTLQVEFHQSREEG